MEFRNARHTDNLKEIEDFYTQIIGLEVLFSFDNHNDYSGVFLGKKDLNWHLEFTSSENKAIHQFDEEDLLVFYPEDQEEYDLIVRRIEKHQIRQYEPRNPFWIDNGILIRDPDGYGVIICNLKIK